MLQWLGCLTRLRMPCPQVSPQTPISHTKPSPARSLAGPTTAAVTSRHPHDSLVMFSSAMMIWARESGAQSRSSSYGGKTLLTNGQEESNDRSSRNLGTHA
jgi:hypothetical protein